MEREIIVVGAGPSGATAAMALAQKGRDVLLLDRQAFPRDKACGDAVPARAVEMLCEFGMREKVQAAGFYSINKLRIVSPNGHLFDAAIPPGPTGAETYIAPRLAFDVLLQQHAVASGAEFRVAQVKAPLLENGRVTGVRAQVNGRLEAIPAKVVIIADGVTSAIARAIRPQQHADRHRAVALRAYIEDLEELPHQVEFHLCNGLLPGYGWIFPIGQCQANIGIGMRLDTFRQVRRSLEDMLKNFLEMPLIRERLKKKWQLRDVAVWPLNLGSQWLRYAYDGALLVGDAAGFINPLTGGGIHNALLSARLAAEAADEALAQGDVSLKMLRRYDRRCRAALWNDMRRSYLIQNWLLRLPRVLDWIIKRMGADSQFARIFTTKL
jgi:menaquinone-9 beta-reductase